MTIETAEILLKILLFIMVACTFGFLMKYIHDFKIVNMVVAKIKGDVFEYDRVRRVQMKKEIERKNSFISDGSQEKENTNFFTRLTTKLYQKIRMTGVSTKFPGFSETMFMMATFLIGAVLFLILSKISSSTVAFVALLFYFIVIWFCLDLIAYSRRMNVEGQLLQFTNECASASRQYSNIIDIIGSVYDQFSGAFREALEECYVEAKTQNDKALAFTHLKEKFDSVQLAFVIDNFDMCSTSTGDYYSVATDLGNTVSIFTSSHERKAATLRNAKANIVVMFILCLIILYFLGNFFTGGYDVIFRTKIGNILIIALAGIFVFGITIKAD